MSDDIVERLRASRTVRHHELDGAALDPETDKWICVECGVAVTYSDEKPDCPGFGGYLEWEAADEIERLQAENARLRLLITAWVDADNAWLESNASQTRDYFSGRTLTVLAEAQDALRKAVGR